MQHSLEIEKFILMIQVDQDYETILLIPKYCYVCHKVENDRNIPLCYFLERTDRRIIGINQS